MTADPTFEEVLYDRYKLRLADFTPAQMAHLLLACLHLVDVCFDTDADWWRDEGLAETFDEWYPIARFFWDRSLDAMNPHLKDMV